MAEGKPRETLVSFKSGHYKTIKGEWKGDSVWCHFKKDSGGMVHVNKEEVEYMESFGEPSEFNQHQSDYEMSRMKDEMFRKALKEAEG